MFYSKLDLFMTLVIASIGITSLGCSGPHTPIGGVWATNSTLVRNGPVSLQTSYFELDRNKQRVEIRFDPPQQKIGQKTPFQIWIHDHVGIQSKHQFIVRYNGVDVTTGFLREAQVHRDGPKDIGYELGSVFLSTDKTHNIEVIYGDSKELLAFGRWSTL